MFLDNVTTIVLIAPVSIHIADTLGIRVIPLLMAEALLSDTGGVAKLVRDPPNIIIGSAAGFSFNDFLTHALPLTLVAWVAALIVLLIVFRRDLAQEPENIDDLMRMRAADAIHDPASLRKILIVFGFVVALFFAHDALHVSPAFIALAGASAGLLWVRPNIERALDSVEWSVLLFFASLFVTVGGLAASGILESAGATVAGSPRTTCRWPAWRCYGPPRSPRPSWTTSPLRSQWCRSSSTSARSASRPPHSGVRRRFWRQRDTDRLDLQCRYAYLQ